MQLGTNVLLPLTMLPWRKKMEDLYPEYLRRQEKYFASWQLAGLNIYPCTKRYRTECCNSHHQHVPCIILRDKTILTCCYHLICFWSENCCRQSADRRQQFSDQVLDRRQQFSDQIWTADSSFQTKFWTADSSFQTHGSYLVFKLSLWGQFSQKPGMLRIEWPIPLRRARSELSYGPACQKGFTSPLRSN